MILLSTKFQAARQSTWLIPGSPDIGRLLVKNALNVSDRLNRRLPASREGRIELTLQYLSDSSKSKVPTPRSSSIGAPEKISVKGIPRSHAIASRGVRAFVPQSRPPTDSITLAPHSPVLLVGYPDRTIKASRFLASHLRLSLLMTIIPLFSPTMIPAAVTVVAHSISSLVVTLSSSGCGSRPRSPLAGLPGF